MDFITIGTAAADETRAFQSLPSTFVGASGDDLTLMNCIIRAWEEIQTSRRDWFWMRTEFSGKSITDGTARYTASDWSLDSRFGDWVFTNPHSLAFPWTIYKASDGVAYERNLRFIEYGAWLDTFQHGTVVENDPIYVTASPAREACFGPVPDTTYTVKGVYRKSVQVLSADADVPELPSDYHRLIQHLAVMKFVGGDGDANVFALAKAEYDSLWSALLREQAPRLMIGDPLA